MRKPAVLLSQEQAKVNAYFQTQSSFWRDIYVGDGVFAEIHRDRHVLVLDWIDSLTLAPGTQVLEVGCGAGFMAVALAQRGFSVQAIDSVEAMVVQARQHAAEAGVVEHVSVDVGNVYALPLDDASCDLVVAVGIIPWLLEPELAIREIARVIRPGGYAVLTADNQLRLNFLLDPWLNPALVPLRRLVKRVLVGCRLRRPSLGEVIAVFHDYHTRRFIDEVLANVGLVKARGTTLGFGPFSLSRSVVVSERCGIMLHHLLQRLADWDVPGFRSTGAQYIVLARK